MILSGAFDCGDFALEGLSLFVSEAQDARPSTC